jgi:putative lipoprotein
VVRMALPPDASVDVRLEDVSLADAPAKVLAENVFAVAGKQSPIPFQLPYNASEIQPSHQYVVRASISVGNKLIFTTTEAYPVITNRAPTKIELVLKPVGATPATVAVAPNSLRGTKWLLIELHGKPVQPSSTNPAHLLLDPDQKRYTGSSGCNRITGTFQLEGTTLQFLGGAMTMMACPEPLMTQEKEFNAALTATGSYQITGNVLELLEGHKVVAKFRGEANPSSGK